MVPSPRRAPSGVGGAPAGLTSAGRPEPLEHRVDGRRDAIESLGEVVDQFGFVVVVLHPGAEIPEGVEPEQTCAALQAVGQISEPDLVSK